MFFVSLFVWKGAKYRLSEKRFIFNKKSKAVNHFVAGSVVGRAIFMAIHKLNR